MFQRALEGIDGGDEMARVIRVRQPEVLGKKGVGQPVLAVEDDRRRRQQAMNRQFAAGRTALLGDGRNIPVLLFLPPDIDDSV